MNKMLYGLVVLVSGISIRQMCLIDKDYRFIFKLLRVIED